jgi:hypothetical protein
MADDPLAAFRRHPAPPPAAERSASGKEPYEAFASKDNQRRGRVDIRPKDGFCHALGYSYIIEVCYDRSDWKSIPSFPLTAEHKSLTRFLSLPFWTEHKSLTSAACSGRFGGDSATGTTASPTVDPMLDTPRAGGKMRSMDPR